MAAAVPHTEVVAPPTVEAEAEAPPHTEVLAAPAGVAMEATGTKHPQPPSLYATYILRRKHYVSPNRYNSRYISSTLVSSVGSCQVTAGPRFPITVAEYYMDLLLEIYFDKIY